MEFRLVGKDFQSWKNFDLNVSGFTVIVGASNRGKSALIRALRGILRNQVQDAFIRKGEKSTELELTVTKGPKIVLTRTKTTTYKVNGEDFAKLAGDIPDPLKALNTHSITVGGTKLDPVFAGQFDSQFMMDLSPSDLNNVLGLFSNTEQLNQGKKQVNSSNTEINSQAKLLATSIQDGQIRITQMKEIQSAFDKLKPRYDTAQATLVSAQTIQTLLGERFKAAQRVGRYGELARLQLPNLDKVAKWFNTGKLLRQMDKSRSVVAGARLLEAPLPKIEVVTIQNHMKNLSEFKTLRLGVQTKKDSIGSTADELNGLHDQLHELTKDITTCPKCGYQFSEERHGTE